MPVCQTRIGFFASIFLGKILKFANCHQFGQPRPVVHLSANLVHVWLAVQRITIILLTCSLAGKNKIIFVVSLRNLSDPNDGSVRFPSGSQNSDLRHPTTCKANMQSSAQHTSILKINHDIAELRIAIKGIVCPAIMLIVSPALSKYLKLCINVWLLIFYAFDCLYLPIDETEFGKVPAYNLCQWQEDPWYNTLPNLQQRPISLSIKLAINGACCRVTRQCTNQSKLRSW